VRKILEKTTTLQKRIRRKNRHAKKPNLHSRQANAKQTYRGQGR